MINLIAWLAQRKRVHTAKRLRIPSPLAATVDVIVPVYRSLADTRRCIKAVLSNPCETRFRLLVINDASPEVEITDWLRDAQRQDARIVLIEHTDNLGFVASVNHGMSLSTDHDVVLLNSDTEVANDWLDRLRRTAYSDQRVASVTPFSNNATICSYPVFCAINPLPDIDTATLDKVFATCNRGQAVDVPTAVGFCMYIRRDCLREVGFFDVENFGMGYGEENDFCIRAAQSGWRNLHALDTYVLHTGGVSFGESKQLRQIEAMNTMRRLHPHYEAEVHAYIALDPAQAARCKVDNALVKIHLGLAHHDVSSTKRYL